MTGELSDRTENSEMFDAEDPQEGLSDGLDTDMGDTSPDVVAGDVTEQFEPEPVVQPIKVKFYDGHEKEYASQDEMVEAYVKANAKIEEYKQQLSQVQQQVRQPQPEPEGDTYNPAAMVDYYAKQYEQVHGMDPATALQSAQWAVRQEMETRKAATAAERAEKRLAEMEQRLALNERLIPLKAQSPEFDINSDECQSIMARYGGMTVEALHAIWKSERQNTQQQVVPQRVNKAQTMPTLSGSQGIAAQQGRLSAQQQAFARKFDLDTKLFAKYAQNGGPLNG
jgi:hypothetical protein